MASVLLVRVTPVIVVAGVALALVIFAGSAALAAPPGDGSAVSNESRGEWVNNLGWFLGGIFGAITAYDRLRRKPVLEVEFLRREEADKRLEKLSGKIDGFRSEVRFEIQLLRGEMMDGTRNVQTKFENVIEKLGELRGPRHA